MGDPGDAARLSNRTPWSLGPSYTKSHIPERRHSHLEACWRHPAGRMILGQLSDKDIRSNDKGAATALLPLRQRSGNFGLLLDLQLPTSCPNVEISQ